MVIAAIPSQPKVRPNMPLSQTSQAVHIEVFDFIQIMCSREKFKEPNVINHHKSGTKSTSEDEANPWT